MKVIFGNLFFNHWAQSTLFNGIRIGGIVNRFHLEFLDDLVGDELVGLIGWMVLVQEHMLTPIFTQLGQWHAS